MIWSLKVHSETISANWKSFKKNEKCFLFHLKSCFCFFEISHKIWFHCHFVFNSFYFFLVFHWFFMCIWSLIWFDKKLMKTVFPSYSGFSYFLFLSFYFIFFFFLFFFYFNCFSRFFLVLILLGFLIFFFTLFYFFYFNMTVLGQVFSSEFWEIFQESFFTEHLLASTSGMVFFFSFLHVMRFVAQKACIWWNNGKLGKGNHKPISSSLVVMEIRQKLHLPNGYYASHSSMVLFKEKEEHP